jgi:hypothetical protein
MHRNLFGRDLTSQFTGSVSTHPVGNHKQVSPCPKPFLGFGGQAHHRILVVRSTHTDIGELSESDS